ncbi:GntR family transcriptional regulator [Ammoniphilus sp. CFH 90114]|uniref:GntR family transcriptional regulator n=1 Tax=Ammoniphilus sp. CFH 90114 TaxID=2493665 RepID=UPI00100DF2CF|nr:GntR family transcriptional regulator [Ammoniphilus sp. CFH 90114]RXT07084.1 GntR family transcriptional regulator [Ammoniphilus sp. CFH 90114]
MLAKLPQSETLSDRAYRELKRAIIQGDFLPGDPLPEESIAGMLGISRTPLRKAITRLAYEGLVELETGKKAKVAEYSQMDLDHTLQLRQLLEPFNAQQIASYMTDDWLDKLDELIQEQKEAIDQNDMYQFIESDSRFHIMLAEMNSNHKLKEFIEQLNTHFYRNYLILSGTLEEYAAIAFSEHLPIIEALRHRQPGAAGEAMKIHIQNIEARLKQVAKEV